MKKHPRQTRYKVINWSDYNRALINRGSLTIWFSEEVIEVWMKTKPAKGENGFGYDPIFWLPEFDKIMAELTIDEKNEISHRGKAARQAQLFLADVLEKLQE